MSKYTAMKTFTLLVLGSCIFLSCQNKSSSEKENVNIDSLVNAKVEVAKEKLEENARREAEENIRQEQQKQQDYMESVRPSGNSLKEREMRYYFRQGYDVGSHSIYSKMDDEWMYKAFMLIVSQHDLSHADNKTLLRSFMAGVAQGRAELKELQN